MPKTELTNLDALRTIAILTVLIDHLVPTLATQLGYAPNWLVAATMHIGQAGVLAFFVHTSMVLMMSLERLQAQSSASTIRFYVRRAFRIYPLAWFTIACVLLLGLPSNVWRTPDPVSWPVIASNVLLVQNVWTKKQIIQPLWSLAYEMQMYLVLPLLFAWICKPKGRTILTGLIALACVGGWALGQLTGGKLNMAAYLPCFMAGVLGFGLLGRMPAVIPSRWWLPFLVAAVAVYVWLHQGEREPVYWIGWAYCLVLAVVIPLFKNAPTQRVTSWVCHETAKYSYGLYLLHVPALYCVFVYLKIDNVLLGSALFFAVTTLASVVSFRVIEDPFIEMGRKLTDAKGRPAASPSALAALSGNANRR